MVDFRYVANLKMNGTSDQVTNWINTVSKLPRKLQEKCVFCPPVCYLESASNLIKIENYFLKLGSQNLDANLKESYTGGIAANMLRDIGCEYVIIGHSERRILAKESGDILSQKLKSALISNLKVIYCIGETLEERNNSQAFDKLASQLSLLTPFSEFKQNISIAYEPIWAIGSGMALNLEDIKETHLYIKETLSDIIGEGKKIPTLYGGSVVEDNANSYYNLKEVDGLLVGGASMIPEQFCKIVNNNT